jgi:hypothetical protein
VVLGVKVLETLLVEVPVVPVAAMVKEVAPRVL